MDRIKLIHVQYLPKELEPGNLYVSEEFGVAGHLCPCGCGNKIITPLGPTEWSFKAYRGKPTLYPSIGNWQLPCRSHYWINNGEIEWSYQWSDEQIKEGYQYEENQRQLYFENLNKKRNQKEISSRILDWFKLLLGKGRDSGRGK